MAIGAHRLPSLRDSSPVQWIIRREFIVDVRRSEIEPLFVNRVPANPQHLQPTHFVLRHVGCAIEFDHVLLERFDTKDILDVKVLHFTRRTFGVHHEFWAITKHATGDPVMLNRGVIKVPNHRCFSGEIHGFVVMRTSEVFGFGLVAGDARFTPHKRSLRTHRLGRPVVSKDQSTKQ